MPPHSKMSSSCSRGGTSVMRKPSWLDGQPLAQLSLVRAREFLREPEAVFWAVMFPIVLILGLGLAFSSRPQTVLKIAAVAPVAGTLRAEPGLDVRELTADAAREALR